MMDASIEHPGLRARPTLVVLLTALAYAVTGWLALQLTLSAGWASPIFPAAGIAIAATATYGWPGALGTALGAIAIEALHAHSLGHEGVLLAVGLPLAIATGAMLQALLARNLLQRVVGLPLALRAPREIVRFALFGCAAACLLNATVSTAALWLSGSIEHADLHFTWWTWWMGDTLGALIGVPIVLTLIGQPREEWAPRRLSVGVPMLLGMLLLGAATLVFHRWEQRQLEQTFVHSADAAADAVSEQLDEAIHALQAIHGMLASHADPRRVSLRPATDLWLDRARGLRAIGFSERVPREQVPEFEAAARAEGLPGYRIFDRADGGNPPANDPFVVAIRAIEPAAGNVAALGVNAMSIGAAREAMLAAAASGGNAATRPFKLTQARRDDEFGVVVYRPLYRDAPESLEARLAQWRGVVFVTLELERALAFAMERNKGPLKWCLVDRTAAAANRLAGPAGCERIVRMDFSTMRPVAFADKSWTLHLYAPAASLPGGQHAGSLLFSIVGLVATAMLGVLLLTMTGRARRIELAVDERTQALSQQVRERRGAEDALRDSEQRLRSILDNVPIGVIFTDARGHVIEANPSMCRMLGRGAEEFSQLTVTDLLHANERGTHLAAVQGLLRREADVVRRQMRMLRPDGSALNVRASWSVLRDPDGGATRLIGVIEDITEHLRLEDTERARDAAEAANRAKSEFVSRMSHELRTPLNAMLGFAQLLGMDRQPALAEHQAGWASQIQHAGWHLLDMINDTLDMSRIEAGLVQLEERPLELAPMVDACLALLSNVAAKRSIRLRRDLDPGLPSVMADETRLKQVLTNLLSNAVKYNRDGGQVIVRARLGNAGSVEIEVHDTGLGMSAAQVGALFQPYNRLGREHSAIEGTGIGLVISRRLAELMGGSLSARSVEGQGSVFTLVLPTARFTDTGTFVSAIDEPVAPRYHQRLVHYIEDNETNVEVMRGILAQRPQVALEVSMSGLDGLAAVRARRPDLILLDMHLPDIGGLELLRHLKSDDSVADIPVLVLSADATPQRIEEALTLGALNYLTKPVDVTGFVHVLDGVLSGLTTRWG
jgi:PAS domain S-box-containing protein